MGNDVGKIRIPEYICKMTQEEAYLQGFGAGQSFAETRAGEVYDLVRNALEGLPSLPIMTQFASFKYLKEDKEVESNG